MDQVTKLLDRPWPERHPLLREGSAGTVPRPSAVLIPLYVRDRQLWTLFTKRTDKVEKHKGQISFPGGGKEDADASLWHTAVRETQEEIGIPAPLIWRLGSFPPVVTVTDYEVTPFVAAVPYPFELTLDEHEVERVIEIPIQALLDPRAVEERPITWKGHQVTTLVYHVAGQVIWGVTALLLTDLLNALRGAGDSREGGGEA
jgi:8-oxo-dGTP pyrophosphatase MutT (NUDIX family)